MNDNKAHNGKHDGIRSIYLALYFIGALVSGIGGNFLWLRTSGPETVAPDRFTGTQAAAVIQTIDQRINHLEEEVDDHLGHHPDRENQFDRRIATLEAQYSLILQNQTRMIQRLDALNDK